MFYFLGIIGSGLILLGFLLRKNKSFGVGTFFYNIINFIGSVFLIIYAIDGKSWPFVILNGVWAIDSFWTIFKNIKKNEK